MFAGNVGFWRSLRPVWRRPLGYQPFIILGVLLSAVAWTVAAFALTVARFATVVVERIGEKHAGHVVIGILCDDLATKSDGFIVLLVDDM